MLEKCTFTLLMKNFMVIQQFCIFLQNVRQFDFFAYLKFCPFHCQCWFELRAIKK